MVVSDAVRGAASGSLSRRSPVCAGIFVGLALVSPFDDTMGVHLFVL